MALLEPQECHLAKLSSPRTEGAFPESISAPPASPANADAIPSPGSRAAAGFVAHRLGLRTVDWGPWTLKPVPPSDAPQTRRAASAHVGSTNLSRMGRCLTINRNRGQSGSPALHAKP